MIRREHILQSKSARVKRNKCKEHILNLNIVKEKGLVFSGDWITAHYQVDIARSFRHFIFRYMRSGGGENVELKIRVHEYILIFITDITNLW